MLKDSRPEIFLVSLTPKPTAFWLQEGEKFHKLTPWNTPKPGSTNLSSHTKIFLRFGQIWHSVLEGLWTAWRARKMAEFGLVSPYFGAEISALFIAKKWHFWLSIFPPKVCANSTFGGLGGRPLEEGRRWDQRVDANPSRAVQGDVSPPYLATCHLFH